MIPKGYKWYQTGKKSYQKVRIGAPKKSDQNGIFCENWKLDKFIIIKPLCVDE